MGDARNLKLRGQRGDGKGQGTGGQYFFVWAKMSTLRLFSCCVHRKDVAGFQGQNPMSGDQGQSPLKLKHFKLLGMQ